MVSSGFIVDGLGLLLVCSFIGLLVYWFIGLFGYVAFFCPKKSNFTQHMRAMPL
jgi:hypothetical protein